MRKSRTLLGVSGLAAALIAAAVTVPATAGATTDRSTAPSGAAANTEYVVLLEQGADVKAARDAVSRAGGSVVKVNANLGTMLVRGPASGFSTKVSASSAVAGAARNRSIGSSPKAKQGKERADAVTKENRAAAKAGTLRAAKSAAAGQRGPRVRGMDPLDDQLWGLRMIRADLAREVHAGRKAVKVGVMDTGVDGNHPDLAPNFDAKLSRNFAPDIPEVDGTCEFRGCVDPANWDDNGHGTHVAGTIAAAKNNLGISGVAPKVSIVNVRAGQDSGYFFLGATTDALTYAGDTRLDVVNMSFYVDPWLYNCVANPADSAEAQQEQRTIIAAMRRALNYAHNRGVTLVGALGNNHEDLGKPRTDTSSPNFPADAAYPRPIDNATCFDLPVEGPHVIGVSALGPSSRKADYSNYGLEQIEVSAPGGWFRDYFGTPWFRTNENLILSTAPVYSLQAEGAVDPAGEITPAGKEFGVQKVCPAGVTDYTKCGYYQFLQGTSMAAPHASGVAALIVSRYGSHQGRRGFGLAPNTVRNILLNSAQERACPNPPLQTYTQEGRSTEFNALCEGTRQFNGFYGHGIVDAYAAVTYRRR